MHRQILALSCSALSSCAIVWGGQGSNHKAVSTVAQVVGRISLDEVVGKKPQSIPIPKLKLYLLRMEDSRSLVDLQQGCRRTMTEPNADPLRAYRVCSQNLRQGVSLIAALPSVATTETDHDGQYKFVDIPAAGGYRIVGGKPVEGGEPILVVGLTGQLRAGERVKLDLSANDPWTRDASP